MTFDYVAFLQNPTVQWGIVVAAFAIFMILLATPFGKGGGE